MRRFVLMSGAAAAAIGAAIALGPSTAAGAAEPLCRRAPALARLPVEVVSQQQQQSDDGEISVAARSRELTSPMPVTTVGEAPPAPPPPPPPPPPAARAERDDGGSSEAVAVTGSLA